MGLLGETLNLRMMIYLPVLYLFHPGCLPFFLSFLLSLPLLFPALIPSPHFPISPILLVSLCTSSLLPMLCCLAAGSLSPSQTLSHLQLFLTLLVTSSIYKPLSYKSQRSEPTSQHDCTSWTETVYTPSI